MAEETKETKETKEIKEVKKKPETKEKPAGRRVKKPADKPLSVSGVSGGPGVTEVKGRLALILIRGLTGTKTSIRNTLYALRLRKKHVCVVLPNIPSNRVAAIKCKDYLAFGEINDDTYQELVAKRGRKNNQGELKKFFALHPPRGGFERKGIKTPFSRGGALGYRGEKMNELIKKML